MRVICDKNLFGQYIVVLIYIVERELFTQKTFDLVPIHTKAVCNVRHVTQSNRLIFKVQQPLYAIVVFTLVYVDCIYVSKLEIGLAEMYLSSIITIFFFLQNTFPH